MPAFLSLIPVRDWLRMALVATVLACGGIWLHRHDNREIAKGEAVVLTQDNKMAAVAAKQVAAGTAAATTTESSNAKTYEAAIAAPAQFAPGLVCRRTGPAVSGVVPQADSFAASGTGDPAADGAVGPPFDPSRPIDERGKLADAQIAYLQARIQELEQQMRNSP